MLTPRVQRMKDKYFDTIPQITAERLVLQTEAYKKFAGEAVPVFRAKVVNYILKVCLGLVLGLHLFVIIKICVRYLFVSRNEEITIL